MTKVMRTDGFYPAEARANRALESDWDTIADLQPIVAKAIAVAHTAGLSTGLVRGAKVAANEARRTGRARRPTPMEACAAYMHGADIEARHLHNWANLVARAGVSVGKTRGAIIDQSMAESILAIEALLHSLLSSNTKGEAA